MSILLSVWIAPVKDLIREDSFDFCNKQDD